MHSADRSLRSRQVTLAVRRQETALRGFVPRCRKAVVLSPGRRRTKAVALFSVREDNSLASQKPVEIVDED